MNQFESALYSRILDQLHSIRNLKEAQIKLYLNLANQQLSTEYGVDENQTTFYVSETDSVRLVWENGGLKEYLDFPRLSEILLQRDGMGSSGESYLVNNDLRLLTPSRFVDGSKSARITVLTIPALRSLEGVDSSGVFKDYREVEVFSSFARLDYKGLKLGLLSEIDVEEGAAMLATMKHKMWYIFLATSFIIWLASLMIARLFTRPFRKLEYYLKQIKEQNYKVSIEVPKVGKDVAGIFEVLDDLTKSTDKAIEFARNLDYGRLEINTFDFGSGVGLALVKMREDLLQEQRKIQKLRQDTGLLLRGAEDKERLRIARELHDGIGPHLTYLKLRINGLHDAQKDVNEIATVIDDIIEEIRNISSSLLPSAIVDVGLIPTIQAYISRFRSEVEIHLDSHEEIPEAALKNELKVGVFRIFQELLNNAIKHSRGNKIVVTLSIFEDLFAMSVSDNGIGFDTQEVYNGRGLTNVKERVDLMGGNLHMESEGGWTYFNIEIPI